MCSFHCCDQLASLLPPAWSFHGTNVHPEVDSCAGDRAVHRSTELARGSSTEFLWRGLIPLAALLERAKERSTKEHEARAYSYVTW
eukprot:scaffold225_cov388-Prasinococcus_capsulatus_cf.AAC.26